MRFYRALQPFKVISFDLDDTLYDNSQVISRAESQFMAFMQRQFAQFNEQNWRAARREIFFAQPLLAENMTAWREQSLRLWLAQQNLSALHLGLEPLIEAAMQEFLHWRHQIEVPAQSFAVLDELAKHYDLAVITNGNVSAERIGFKQFSLHLQGGAQGRAKPHCDLFLQTAAHFGVRPQEILHIGDNLITDVEGAIQAGCQTVWINLSGKKLNQFGDARTLPTLEINDLTELLNL